MPARSRRTRAARPALTRDRVVDAALALVDARGLEALSMRSLGRALGVEAMSLYQYFPSKAELLRGIADRLTADAVLPSGPKGSWREDLVAVGRAVWRVMEAHPRAVPVLVVSPLDTPANWVLSETVLRLFARAGYEPAEAHQLFRICQAFAFGAALMLQARPPKERVRKQLEAVGEAVEFPLLAAALASADEFDPEADFEHGLGLLLDGVELTRRRSRRAKKV